MILLGCATARIRLIAWRKVLSESMSLPEAYSYAGWQYNLSLAARQRKIRAGRDCPARPIGASLRGQAGLFCFRPFRAPRRAAVAGDRPDRLLFWVPAADP